MRLTGGGIANERGAEAGSFATVGRVGYRRQRNAVQDRPKKASHLTLCFPTIGEINRTQGHEQRIRAQHYGLTSIF
jgi:hypothetical protein